MLAGFTSPAVVLIASLRAAELPAVIMVCTYRAVPADSAGTAMATVCPARSEMISCLSGHVRLRHVTPAGQDEGGVTTGGGSTGGATVPQVPSALIVRSHAGVVVRVINEPHE